LFCKIAKDAMKTSKVVFVAFILFAIVEMSFAQDEKAADEEIDVAHPGNGYNLSDDSADKDAMAEQVPKQQSQDPSQKPSQDQTDPKSGQDSQVNAGNIKVVLKTSKVIANPLTEGTKYKIALSWDMTFSQFIKRTGTRHISLIPILALLTGGPAGFRYSIGGTKFIRYAVHNRLMDPFQLRQSQRFDF
jgi:hypothetical protein